MLKFQKLSVRKKLLLPNISYIIIIALLSVLLFLFNQKSSDQGKSLVEIHKLQNSLNSYSHVLKNYIHDESSFSELESEYKAILSRNPSVDQRTTLEKIFTKLK